MNGKNINLRWKEDGGLAKVCPEVGGGMKIPRPPAQIVDGSGLDVLNGKARVMDNEGCDVTGFLSKELNMRSVSLKNMGVTAALLTAARFVDKPGTNMSEK